MTRSSSSSDGTASRSVQPSYRLPDEPRPSAVARLAVNPVWPFFATMFCGAWLATPWWLVNGLALGSMTRGREVVLALASLAGAVGIALGLSALRDAGLISSAALRYAVVCVPAWRLLLAYFLLDWQLRSFQLFEHFGGRSRRGLAILLLGVAGRFALVAQLPSTWVVAALT